MPKSASTASPAATPAAQSTTAQGVAQGSALVVLDDAINAAVKVTLNVQIGSVRLSLHDLMTARAGEVIELDSHINDPVRLYVEDALVALGELVAVDDRFGVKITEISK